MAVRFDITITPGKPTEVKKDVTITAALADPTADLVSVQITDTVELRRGNEIVNTMEWLLNGVKDRNLIDYGSPDFKGSALVTAVLLDDRTTSNRRTAADSATAVVANGDIVLTMGANVTDLGNIVIIATAFEQLRRAVQEYLYANG